MDYYQIQKKEAEGKRFNLELASKLLVAGELLRRDWPTFLIYGSDGALAVSLKTATQTHPVTIKMSHGESWEIPEQKADFLVFVKLPREISDAPEYFIASHEDIQEVIQERRNHKYQEWEKSDHKGIFGSRVFVEPREVLESELLPLKSNWSRLALRYGLPRVDWNSPREGRPVPR